jgi:hypothetical protein
VLKQLGACGEKLNERGCLLQGLRHQVKPFGDVP